MCSSVPVLFTHSSNLMFVCSDLILSVFCFFFVSVAWAGSARRRRRRRRNAAIQTRGDDGSASSSFLLAGDGGRLRQASSFGTAQLRSS